jgi:hypothetical protein
VVHGVLNLFGINWDKLIRHLTGGRYCLARTAAEHGQPVTIGEAIKNVEATGGKIDQAHAAVISLIGEIDVLHSDVLAIREFLKIPPSYNAVTVYARDIHPVHDEGTGMTGVKAPPQDAAEPPPSTQTWGMK